MNSSKVRREILAKIAALQMDLAALDRLEREYGMSKSVDQADDGKPSKDASPHGEAYLFASGKSLADVVREAIEALGETVFTKGDLIKLINSKYPAAQINEPSVATMLSRLGRSNAIQLVERGLGTSPSKYRNPNPSNQMKAL